MKTKGFLLLGLLLILTFANLTMSLKASHKKSKNHNSTLQLSFIDVKQVKLVMDEPLSHESIMPYQKKRKTVKI